MRRYLYPFLILMTLVLPAAAQDTALTTQDIEQFRPQPFHEMAALVAQRYSGRMVAAQIQPPTAQERAMGASLIYEFRLVTTQRNLLNIRIDARDGKFLDVAGRGQLQARRK
ncbi:hypothetical protein H4P12_03265 [Paracoccus sp. 11-3]|uniref:PepSY domain-containing protein n=1 Tax=Paracoccus amoyensis TaxID=2760093 RepID=A0A926G9F7_9RHOB|nr:hypothetical protein [Paracoccus amoyensis]MBC9245751.1 hypothetical protein [Paracoccus amoyensis]